MPTIRSESDYGPLLFGGTKDLHEDSRLPSYKTLKKPGKIQKEFKNSVFIAYARPVKSEDEAKAFVKEIKKLHPDANHNVSAYIVKNEKSLALKYDDDGEPAGSSGKPIFKVLELIPCIFFFNYKNWIVFLHLPQNVILGAGTGANIGHRCNDR